MAVFTYPAFAKINLFLKVLGRRPDGYHELLTLFQTISLADQLSFERLDTPDVRLTCSRPDLAVDETNLVLRAARELQRVTGCTAGARIHLEKNIPLGAGLGGGSSDAATTLMALQRLWEVSLPAVELHTIAAGLGADVPFFLVGGTAAGTGRGDLIESVPDFEWPYLLLANPGVEVPTGKIFRLLKVELTSPDSVRILPAYFFQPPSYLPSLYNTLEEIVFQEFPIVARVWQEISSSGALSARMSGSGATVFGVFPDRETLETAQRQLQAHHWHLWPCQTINRAEFQAYFSHPQISKP